MDLRNNEITLGEIMQNKDASKLIQSEFGNMMKGPLYAMAKKMSLKKILIHAEGKISKEKVDELLLKLKNI